MESGGGVCSLYQQHLPANHSCDEPTDTRIPRSGEDGQVVVRRSVAFRMVEGA